MKNFSRAERLGSQIKRELSEMLLGREGIPAGVIISITEVDLSKDLRLGKIYYSVLGNENALNDADAYLRSHTKQLRMELVNRIRVRFAPEIKFLHDNSMERGQRIEELLDKIKNEDKEQRD